MQPVLLTPDTNRQQWKDTALKKAEVITDAWEVAKAYAGRAAEWVLFLCMIANIITMLPGMDVSRSITNLVLGVQVVMLDIGGMSLSSMAAHIRERGKIAAAKKASTTSTFLIGLMILTLLLVSIGVLFPALKSYTDMGEKGLILVRVVMTVIYSHVIHSLRSSGHQAPAVPATPSVPDNAELENLIKAILVPVLQQYHTETKADIAEQIKQAISSLGNAVSQKEALQPPAPTSLIPMRRINSAPQPLQANEHRLNRDARIEAAYQELLSEGIRPTGDTLSRRARCNRAVALSWLKDQKAAG